MRLRPNHLIGLRCRLRLPLRPPSPLKVRPLSTTISNPNPSTTAIGTAYENLTLHALHNLSFDLTRVGGRSDHGIDLIGHWHPPSPTTGTSNRQALRIPVIVQCKAHAKSPSPAWIRELEGALVAASEGWRDGVGVLVSKGQVTPGVREAVMAAERGLMWVQLEVKKKEGIVRQVLWNRTVKWMVGEGLGVGFVYRTGDGDVKKELRLMVDGRVVESKDEAE